MFRTKTHQLTTLAITLVLAGATVAAAPLDGHPRAAERLDMRMARMAERLDLSDAQREEIRALLEDHHSAADASRAQLREQIDAVLTAQQRARWDDRRRARMEARIERMVARLDLTDAQCDQVAAILAQKQRDPGMTRTEVRERLAAVLTDEQQAQLRGMREARRAAGPGERMGRGW
ncbi:Spy/CpxP family protein refolding chaperone [uncultured Thiohalocapsa sp.]|uniref:Spy/CpxP family protein refolding chaperone n=1 Tax=uncultured Thiohalocapsa sp. TaxID=768990 RepID=UPI0025DA02F8|nr:Spy/CpxP family protein refolding chaperone [uncultured Thiohalocapsa sp.]